MPKKGWRRGLDGQYYYPPQSPHSHQPSTSTEINTMPETEEIHEVAAAEAVTAMRDNPPPAMEATGTADARKQIANHGDPQNPLAAASNEFLADLQNLVDHHKDYTSKVATARPSVPEAEKMADAKALDLVRQVDAEKRRRAQMSPEEFRASSLPPISSMILHMRADPSHLVNARGERPCERDEVIHWASTDNAQTDRSDDPQWVLAATASGSRLIKDENGAPIYRHGCVAMKCKAEQSAHRKAFALEGKSQLGIRESQHRDHSEMEASRQAGISTGAMQTRQKGMVDPFEAARMRPGDMNIPIS